MRPSVLLAFALTTAGCAGAGAPGPTATPGRKIPKDPSTDYVAVSRAMTEIDAAERQGELADELRWARAAERAPRDAAAQFLAVAAQPGSEDRWDGYRDLTLQFPRSALPWVGMARTYVSWRTWDQAQKAIAGALKRDPDCWLALRVRAEMAEARANPDAARVDYQKVLEYDPRNPEAHFGLARLARARGDLEEAHAQAAAALEEARSIPGAWEILGEISQEVGEPGVAIDFWKGAVDQAPRDRNARVALARLYAAQGRHADAAAQWQAAVELEEDAESLTSLADAARNAGDRALEQRALERLARLKPSADQWKRVAAARMASKDWPSAERAYQRVLEASPKDEEANLGIGRIRLARGDSQRAVEALRLAGAAGREDLAALEKRLNLEKLSRQEMNGLQRSVQTLVDRTFRASAAQKPSLAGTIRVRVTVDGTGGATLVEVLEDSLHDNDVRACAYWNLHDATYPPERPGRYSFAFAFRR